MYARKATVDELELIYMMGFDIWGDGASMADYLDSCRLSKKYQSGTWYVFILHGNPVSSLLVYSNHFGLKEGCFGIGSVLTSPKFRRQGHGTKLVSLVKENLLSVHHAKAIYLHSDIDRGYYAKLGFTSVQGTDCMCISNDPSYCEGPIPSYF